MLHTREAQPEPDEILSLLDELQDLVYVTDAARHITYYNEAFRRIFRYPKDFNLAGLSISHNYVEPNHRDIFETSLRLFGGEVQNYLVLVKRYDNEQFYLSVDSNWRREAEENGIEGTGRDVTPLLGLFEGFFQVRYDGVITFCTHRTARLLGFTDPTSVIGKSIDNVLGDPPEWHSIEARQNEQIQVSLELRLNSENESACAPFRRVVDVQLRPFVVRDELALAYQGVIVDRTEEQMTRSALEESNTLNKFLIDNAWNGVYAIQRDEFVIANPTICKLLGYDSLIGMSFSSVVSGEDRSRVADEVQKKLTGQVKDPYQYEFAVETSSGSRIPVRVLSGPAVIRGERSVYGYLRDATEEKAREEQIAEATSELQKSLDDKKLLLEAVVHEMESPIAGIRGLVDELLEKASSTDLTSALQDIDLICRLMVMLVKNVKLSQVESFGSHYPSDWVHLQHDVVEKAIALMKPLMRNRGLPIDEDHVVIDDKGLAVYASINQELFLQAFFNFLSNAVKYAKENVDDFKVRIYSTKDRRGTWLYVVDHGIGFPKDESAAVFKHRIRGSNVRDIPGMGLGLWVTQRILEEFDCKVQVTGRVDPTSIAVLIPPDRISPVLP